VITTGAEEERVEREVPIRVATATRSAHRHDLIRMLAPVVTVPQAFPIRVSIRTFALGEHADDPHIALDATVFFEHSGADPVMLPANQMWARVHFDTSHVAYDLPPFDMSISRSGEMTSEPFGIQQTRDGVVVSGPGSLDVTGRASFEGENLLLLRQVTSPQVRLSFGVAGMDRRVELLATLYRPTPLKAGWYFKESPMNPWSDLPEP
jgi:hypothetical protein